MGANAKKIEHYNNKDWREVCCTVGQMIRWRWTVEERCHACHVRLVADLEQILKAKGETWSLWGDTIPCRSLTLTGPCQGRMAYFGGPPHWQGIIELTGPPGMLSKQYEQARQKEAARRHRASAKGEDGIDLPAWCQSVGEIRAAIREGGGYCVYRCPICKAHGDVDLDRIIADKGPTYSLIDRTAPCRTIAPQCEGLVWFTAARTVSDVRILRTRKLPTRRAPRTNAARRQPEP